MIISSIYENLSMVSDIMKNQMASEKYTNPKEAPTNPSLKDYEADDRQAHPNQNTYPKYPDPPQQRDVVQSPYVQRVLDGALGK